MFKEKPTESTPAPEGREQKAMRAEDELIEILEGNELPEEIRQRLEDEYYNDEKSPEELLEETKHIMEKRKKVNHTFSEREERECYYEEHIEEEIERAKQELKLIMEEGLNNKMETLGSGRTAKVVKSTINSDCCYKIINNADNYRKGNDVAQETQYLDELTDIEETYTKVPRPYCYEMQKEGHVYVMEEVDGVSLEDIYNHNASLPPGFDPELFFNDKFNLHHRRTGKCGK